MCIYLRYYKLICINTVYIRGIVISMDMILPYKKDYQERENNKNAFFNHYGDYFNIVCVEDYEERYEVFNNEAKESKEDYIALADTDAIVDIEQINIALFKLENGADMVYPYDHVINLHPDGTQTDDWPKGFEYGLMVMFNRKSFLEFGCENENFKGYGWEDLERYYRALNAGLKVERVTGVCYHLTHPRDGFKNPFFNYNMGLMKKEKMKRLKKTTNLDMM